MIGVIVVDDDPLTLGLHRDYVDRLEGFRVLRECAGARAATAAILDPSVGADLVLLDVTMPDGTGLDVLRHVRAHGSAIDVIAISAVRDAEVVTRMVSLGVAQYLVKPFAFATFRERMERYLDYRSRAQDAAGPATQEEIDALLGARHPAVAPTPPKGLSSQTLEQVSRDVRDHGPASASETAHRLGMSRVSARRYLEHLTGAGRVERSPRYGTPGRPESEYRWRR